MGDRLIRILVVCQPGRRIWTAMMPGRRNPGNGALFQSYLIPSWHHLSTFIKRKDMIPKNVTNVLINWHNLRC